MDAEGLVARLASSVANTGSARLAQTIGTLISSGELRPGMKLPPIRTIAQALGMSPSAVGQSWSSLRERGLIETRTRGGTVVMGPRSSPHPVRFAQLVTAADAGESDLGRPLPDPTLLPDVRSVFARVAAETPDLNLSDPPAATARLREAARAHWPFAVEDVMAVHRGIDGVEQALLALVQRGETVAVEDPSVPRVLDIVDRLGLRVLPIAWRERGPDLRELGRAVRAGAKAFLYQPNGHSPTGANVDDEWLSAAAAVLQPSGTLAIELDNFALLHEERRTLGRSLPETTLLIDGFGSSHGPDVQVALLGGSAAAVERVRQQVAYSHRWVSRLLQDSLAWMLLDPGTRQHVARSAAEYGRRHATARDWLRSNRLDVSTSTTAPSIWIPVADDDAVTARLAERGISVLPARLFERRRAHRRHIHINGGVDVESHLADFEILVEIVDAVAAEERAARRDRDRALREAGDYQI
ncbi:GntR family transcriptional regulator [Agromyces allii]|uniref:Aminotransferase class I/II-fold pyridoxal phosphate-dependent enzyme n=1 Tax=Agromyces allii TaxID=393607 RepID=A0ABN2QFI4_9MICO|nr:PLP-dependent aminotransferase family protein [Agromyces allii]